MPRARSLAPRRAAVPSLGHVVRQEGHPLATDSGHAPGQRLVFHVRPPDGRSARFHGKQLALAVKTAILGEPGRQHSAPRTRTQTSSGTDGTVNHRGTHNKACRFTSGNCGCTFVEPRPNAPKVEVEGKHRVSAILQLAQHFRKVHAATCLVWNETQAFTNLPCEKHRCPSLAPTRAATCTPVACRR